MGVPPPPPPHPGYMRRKLYTVINMRHVYAYHAYLSYEFTNEVSLIFLYPNSDYVKAKKCLKNLLLSECIFNSQDEEAINFQLDDYNPFCANNRDPGATGSAHCSDYQVVSTTAVATILPCSKSNVISSKQLILFFLLAVYLVFI